MRVMTGKEDRNGCFPVRCVGESNEGETPKQALQRVAERFLNAPLTKKKHRWNEAWGRLGPHDNPTERLPALFVGSRLFEIDTDWDKATDEHTIA